MAKPSTDATINTGTAFGAAITNAWLMNEGSGPTVASLGTANNGTLAGTAAWASQAEGPYINFPAYTDHIGFANTVTMSGAFTLVTQVNITDINADFAVILGATSGNYALALDTTNLYMSSGGNYVTVAHGLTIPGTWYQFAVVRDASNNTIFYVNASAKGSPQSRAGDVLFHDTGYTAQNFILYGSINWIIVANGYAASSTEISNINSDPYQYFSVGGGPPSASHTLAYRLS